MPRQRMVKPEFFDSESLGLCSVGARLLFVGLWVMGDDYGNQKAQLTKLQLRIFPYDEMEPDHFVDLLCELEAVGCIKGYEVAGERYINVPNFGSYQTVRKPSKTNVPEPPEGVKKALVTSVMNKWRTSTAPVPPDDGSTPPVTHHDATSDPERKKEGSNFSLREKIANERGGKAVAAAASAAPPLPEGWVQTGILCPRCKSHEIKKPNGDLVCPKCDPVGFSIALAKGVA